MGSNYKKEIMKNRVLIKTYGFIGDILFASSIAEKLKIQNPYCIVDYCIGFPQPYKLLKNNPYIDNVFLSKEKGPRVILPDNIDLSTYNQIYELPECRQDIQPTIWYQQYCGIANPTPQYEVYTDRHLDESIKYELSLLNKDNKKVIGYVANWKNLTISYTKEEYSSGLKNVKDIMSHSQLNTRDVDTIINKLNEDYIIIPIGYEHGVTQYHTALDSTSTYTNTASILKICDLVIGQEGGLTNLAAGVGTRCIITTDFVHALYGPSGIMKKFDKVNLGPANLFPNKNHINLDPFIFDDDIIKIIKNEL
jgi:hypothetical protein